MRDADMPEGSLSPVLLGDTLARIEGQQFSGMQNMLLFAVQVDCPDILRSSHQVLSLNWLMEVFKSGVGNPSA